jgi:hypothetical protein
LDPFSGKFGYSISRILSCEGWDSTLTAHRHQLR